MLCPLYRHKVKGVDCIYSPYKYASYWTVQRWAFSKIEYDCRDFVNDVFVLLSKNPPNIGYKTDDPETTFQNAIDYDAACSSAFLFLVRDQFILITENDVRTFLVKI